MRLTVPTNHARWLRVQYAIVAALCLAAAMASGSVPGAVVLGGIAVGFAWRSRQTHKIYRRHLARLGVAGTPPYPD